MSKVICSFRSLSAGSRVFALLILFLYVILHTMWSGKSLQLICILPFGKLCPVGFLVVCKCSSVLLQSIGMSYVDCGDDG